MSVLYDSLGVDSLLQVMAYMNVKTLARMACSSRLGAVAAYEAQQQPALLVLKGSPEQVAKDLCERLTARPTVAFLQWALGREKREDEGRKEVIDFLQKRLPPTTEVIAAHTESNHCAWFRENPIPDSKKPPTTQLDIAGHRLTSTFEISVLLATLPEAKAHAFHIKPPPGRVVDDDSDEDSYSSEGGEKAKPATAENKAGYERAGAESTAVEKDPLEDLLSMDPPPEVVVIHHAARTHRTIDQIQAKFPKAAIIGGVVMGGKVIARSNGKEMSHGSGLGVLAISGNAPLFAMTCPFEGDPKEAYDYVKSSLKRATDYATEKDERLLGALLFTCNGRGASMFGKHGMDAALFQAEFPNSQLLGYYAGGEIGPAAESTVKKQTFLRGNAQMQGFTAVYGVFCVPRKHAPSAAFSRAILYGEVEEAFKEISA